MTYAQMSALLTVGVLIAVYLMADNPGIHRQSLEKVAAVFIALGIPIIVLMAMCLSTGKWAGFFMLCGLVSIIVGYVAFGGRR